MKTYRNTDIDLTDVITADELAEVAKKSLGKLGEGDEKDKNNISIIVKVMEGIFYNHPTMELDADALMSEIKDGDTSGLDELFSYIEHNGDNDLIGEWYIESYLEEMVENSGKEFDPSAFPFSLMCWDHRAIENTYSRVDVNGSDFFYKKFS